MSFKTIKTVTFEGHTWLESDCHECGGTYAWTPGTPGGNRTDALVIHMIEKGEMTLGDARKEMTGFEVAGTTIASLLHPTTKAYIAEWSMWARDNGLPDTYRRGDDLTPYFG